MTCSNSTISKVVAGVFLLSMFCTTSVCGQEYELGLEAYQAGRFHEAIEIWRPLATGGNMEAQFGLGVLYHAGEGADLDVVQAVNWFRRAAEIRVLVECNN